MVDMPPQVSGLQEAELKHGQEKFAEIRFYRTVWAVAESGFLSYNNKSLEYND